MINLVAAMDFETQKQYLLLGRDGGLASRVACVGGAINT